MKFGSKVRSLGVLQEWSAKPVPKGARGVVVRGVASTGTPLALIWFEGESGARVIPLHLLKAGWS